MARNPRYPPPGGALVEVTCRAVQGRLLLRPSRRLNEIVVGVLARRRSGTGLPGAYPPGTVSSTAQRPSRPPSERRGGRGVPGRGPSRESI